MTADFFAGAWFIRFYLGFFLIVLAFGGGFFAWAYRAGHLRNDDRVRSMPLLIELPGDPPQDPTAVSNGPRGHGTNGSGNPVPEAGGNAFPASRTQEAAVSGRSAGPANAAGPAESAGSGGHD
jgi:hypothetical protein